MNLKYATLVEWLETKARLNPNAIACTFFDDTQHLSLTWQELQQKSRAVAVAISAIAAPGDRVIIVLPPGIDFLVAVLGCLYAEVIVLPISPSKPAYFLQTLKGMVEQIAPVIFLSSASMVESISTNKAVKHWSQWPVIHKMASLWQNSPLFLPGFEQIPTVLVEAIPIELAVNYQHRVIDPSTTAFIQYTSGATGRPKGVMLSHDTILVNLEMSRLDTQMTARDVCVSWLSPYHVNGLIAGMLQPMYCQASLYFMPTALFMAHPLRWLQAITTYKATISGAPDFAWQLCIDTISAEEKKQLDLSSWELAFCGGDLVRPETLEAFYQAFRSCGIRKNSFYAAYGLTELTMYVLGSKRNQGIITEHIDSKTQSLASYHVNDWQHIRIMHPDSLTECALGDIGEIWISSVSVARGYWQEPSLTKAVFHNFIGEQGPFLRTGDLGCFKQGKMIVLGRCAERMTINNKYYYPQCLEKDLGHCHSNLIPNQVAAFATAGGLVIVAEVENINKERAKAIFSTMSRCIYANYNLHVHDILLIPRGTLKKTDNGKIKRLLMRHLYLNNNIDSLYRWDNKTTAIDLVVLTAEKIDEVDSAAKAPAVIEAPLPDEPDPIDKAIRSEPLVIELPSLANEIDDFIERQLFSTPLD